jgi:DNA-binding transcriptional LysR family regulator
VTSSAASPSFRLAYVPGTTPGKWVRTWTERFPGVPLDLVAVAAAEAPGLLRDDGADAGVVRLPVDRAVFSAIPLYTETTVVMVPKDHVVTAADEITVADLADDVVLHPLDDVLGWERPPGLPAFERPATTADAVELVAAGVGLLLVPQSLARLHHRRDLTYRPVTDAPQSGVALSWPEDATTELVDDFIGVVRGRTVNSTRGRAATDASGKSQKAGGAKAGFGKTPGGAGRPGAARSGQPDQPRSGSRKPPGAKRGRPRRRS